MIVLGLGLATAVVAWLGVLAIDKLIERPGIGAALILAMTLMQATLVDQVPALTLPGGTRVMVHDVVFILVFTAGLARLLRLTRFSTPQRWLVLFLLLLLISTALGVAHFGLQRGVAEFRLFFAYVSGAVYFATFPPSAELLDRIGRLWLAASVAMMALVCLRWLDVLGGISLGVPLEKFGNDAELKVIDGPYTFLLAHALILTAAFWPLRGKRATRLRWLAGLLLLFVVLLNRRTVWLALIAGAAVIASQANRSGIKLGRRTVVGAVSATIIVVSIYLAISGFGAPDEALARPAVHFGTLEWRIQGWKLLLQSWWPDPVHWVIGEPMGTGFERRIDGSVLNSEAHNFYFNALLRTGTVGLIALLGLTVGLLRRLWWAPVRGGLLAPELFSAMLIMQIIWFMTWTPGPEQGMLTGLAVAMATAMAGKVGRQASARADRGTQGLSRRRRLPHSAQHVHAGPAGAVHR